MIAAAGKNNNGIVGIAYDATIMAIRTDEPGSCVSEDGCSFGDVSDAIDWAVDHGATVINISLGGAFATPAEIAAVERAANAGIVVVVSAGNDGGVLPDRFPRSLAAEGFGNVIIVGSVDSSGNISDFTDKAVGSSQYYMTALGEEVLVNLPDGNWLVSGTSFSAPQVAGAVALLKQAFPTLTGQQIVQLLFETAQDVGAPGVDNIYGWGILDIYEAFQPQGMVTLPDSGLSAMGQHDTVLAGSPAMGDALATASLHTVMLDKYERAFAIDLGRSMRGAAVSRRLWGAVGGERRFHSIASGKASLAFTVDRSARLAPGSDRASQLTMTQEEAQQARVLAARVALRVAPDTQLGITYAESPDGLVAMMRGQDRPAFMIAQGPEGDEGIFRRSDVSFALRQQIGSWGLTLSAESGVALSGAELDLARAGYPQRTQDGVRGISMALDRRFGAFGTTLGISWMGEDRTILGARFHDSLGGGADTVFLDAGASWMLGENWRLGAALRSGWTFAGGSSLIASGSRLTSRAWSLDLERRGVFSQDDRLAIRFAQPLRVEGGSLRLDLPVAYSYASLSPSYGTRILSLSPEGRELMGELAWRGPLWGGWGSASLFYRREPGHYSFVPDDAGVALRWSADF